MKKIALAVALSTITAGAAMAEETVTADVSAAPEIASVSEDFTALDLAAPEVKDAGGAFVGKDRTGFSLRGGVSTLGAGGEVGYRFTDKFGVRAPFGSADMDFKGEFEGYDIDGKIKTGGVGLMVDYFPMGGAFRISGGAFHTDYSASGIASDIDVDGVTTDVSLEFSQKSNFAPVAAMGWDWQIGKHGLISTDLGAIFGSGFDVKAKESSGLVSQDRVDSEFDDVRDAAGKIKVLPYVKVMVGFKF